MSSIGNSRFVTTSQKDVHPNLKARVQKHKLGLHRRLFADHSKAAFERLDHWLQTRRQPIILDSCCGVGDSSRMLARAHPDDVVVGVDQSLKRLGRERAAQDPDNLLLVRADLQDLWPLMERHGYRLKYHYLLYPNPWPKPGHLKRRWHAMPCFKALVVLGGTLEVRSNWRTYVEEMALALMVYNHSATITSVETDGDFEPLSPFEAKYAASGHALYRLQVGL